MSMRGRVRRLEKKVRQKQLEARAWGTGKTYYETVAELEGYSAQAAMLDEIFSLKNSELIVPQA